MGVAAVPVRNSLRDRRHEVPFPETATYYFVAATQSCLAGGGVPQRPPAGNESLTTLRLPAQLAVALVVPLWSLTTTTTLT